MLLNTPITRLLKSLSNVPAIAYTEKFADGGYKKLSELSIKIKGQDAGTMGKPNQDMFLAQSTPSSFGKGEEMVMDPEYRNGREIVAEDVELEYRIDAATLLPQKLFQAHGWQVDAKLHKVAIYEKGGKFDWHRDTTHGDAHHATVLIALNNQWEDGELVLRHAGQEVPVDLHPQADGEQVAFKMVTFYTDVEHKVKPVTKGTRIVLQYDVSLTPLTDSEDEEENHDPFAAGAGVSPIQYRKSIMDLSKLVNPFDAYKDNSADLEQLTKYITDMHTSQKLNEVGFALSHLYRKASIRPEYLKGIDAVLYAHLSKTFDVSLCPVTLDQVTTSDGSWDREALTACKSPSIHDAENQLPKGPLIDNAKIFHLPPEYSSKQLSSVEYLEHTGNEPQYGECTYFSGGMFVALRDLAKVAK